MSGPGTKMFAMRRLQVKAVLSFPQCVSLSGGGAEGGEGKQGDGGTWGQDVLDVHQPWGRGDWQETRR